jgi:uncharacterized repeat protein (TIGR01451 family)
VVTNSATVTETTPDPGLGDETATASTGIVGPPGADLTTTMTGTVITPPGGPVTYTVTVVNNGPDDAFGVVITDTPGSGLLNATGPGCTGVPLVCPLGDLPALASTSIIITATADPTLRPGAVVTNSATVTETTVDPGLGDETATASTGIITPPGADLTTTMTGTVITPPGGPVTYTVTVVNNGPDDAEGVVLTDTPGSRIFGATAPGCTGVPLVCPIGFMPALGSASITITGTVDPTLRPGEVVLNSATVTETTVDPGLGDETATASTGIVGAPGADLTTTMSGTVITPPGGPVTYTATVVDNGPDDAAGVVLTVTPGSGLVGLSAPGCSGSPLVCPIGPITALGSVSITLSGTVDPALPAGAVVTVSATVTQTTVDPGLGDETASSSTGIGGGSADLAVTKTGPATVSPGAPVTYTVTVTNNGPSSAAGVVLTDTPGSGLLGASAPGCVGSPLSCTIGALAVGASASFTVSATASAALADGTNVINTATVTSGTPDLDAANNTVTITTPVTAATTTADLAVTKTGPATATPGAPLTYTLTVTNNGPSAASGVTLTDTPGAGILGAAAAGCSGSPLVCPIGTLAAGATATVTVTATADPSVPAGSVLTNAASVTAATPDPVSGNNNASVSTTVGAASADVAVTKTGTPTVTPGGALTYTVTVTNNGPSDAAGVSLTDVPGAGMVGIAAAGCAGAPLTCPVGALAVGAAASFTVTATADPASPPGTALTDTATATATTADPTPGNNTATATTQVGPGTADLALQFVAPATVNPGASFDYTMTVTNNGPSDATGVVLADTLPTGVSFVSATGASCTPVVSCALGTVPAGSSTVVTLHVAADANLVAGTVLTNSATLSAATADPTPGNNSATVTSTVGALPSDVSVAVSSPTTVVAGTEFSYTATVTNAGPSTATDAKVSLPLAPEAGCTSVTGTGLTSTTCTSDDPAARLAPLAAGASVTVTVTALLSPSTAAGTQLTFLASVGNSGETNPGNNTDTAVATVVTQAALSLTKTGQGPFSVGSTAGYAFTVANSGPSDARDVTVTDTLPASLRFVSSPNCTASGQQVTCALGTVPAGGQVTATVAVTVAQDTPPGTTIVNTAVVNTSTPPGPGGPALPATVSVVTVPTIVPTATPPPAAGPLPAHLPVTGAHLLAVLGTGLLLLLAGLALVRIRRKV